MQRQPVVPLVPLVPRILRHQWRACLVIIILGVALARAPPDRCRWQWSLAREAGRLCLVETVLLFPEDGAPLRVALAAPPPSNRRAVCTNDSSNWQSAGVSPY